MDAERLLKRLLGLSVLGKRSSHENAELIHMREGKGLPQTLKHYCINTLGIKDQVRHGIMRGTWVSANKTLLTKMRTG